MPNWNGEGKWYNSSIQKILTNEKYKGDDLLQRTYIVDFFSKERAINRCGNITLKVATSVSIMVIKIDRLKAS